MLHHGQCLGEHQDRQACRGDCGLSQPAGDQCVVGSPPHYQHHSSCGWASSADEWDAAQLGRGRWRTWWEGRVK
uniref:Uncharacterized protein n=1 Tax=Arundo donax TaxID=35708 RepID=A0A0A9EFJ7_ARUDO